MVNFENDVGFYYFGEWRYGPLYVFIPIAAQSIATGTPFTIEDISENKGEVLLGYNGEILQGNEEIGKLVVNSMEVLRDDFLELIALGAYRQSKSEAT